MAVITDLYAEARRCYHQGRPADARRLLQRVLEIAPRHAASLHLLGRLAFQSGHTEDAIGLVRRAVEADGRSGYVYCDLGVMLGAAGQFEPAVAAYRAALGLNPADAVTHHNLSVALRTLGRSEEAISACRAALQSRPDYADAHGTLGDLLAERRRFDEAERSYRAALDLRPDSVETWNNLGIALMESGRAEDAAAAYRTAISLRPTFAEAYSNLANALRTTGNSTEAITAYGIAIRLKPDLVAAYGNLANTLRDLGRLEEADTVCRAAIRAAPDHAEAHATLGNVLYDRGLTDQAIFCYQTAIALRPDFAEAHLNLAATRLMRGEFDEGWREFEWRWEVPLLKDWRRPFSQPQWRGEAAAGRTLLIHAEQGFGDTLQFCRYAALAKERGFTVVLEVPPPLLRLLGSLEGIDRLVGQGESLPEFDLHCPLLSLPLALGTRLATIPAKVPYLTAPPAQATAWRSRLAALGGQGPRVGLVWAGSPRHGNPQLAAVDRRRSMAAEMLAPLLRVPEVRFFSLQLGGQPPEGFAVHDFMAEMNDFADTAALVANLDLVVSVDTAVLHLAGALGRPVWLLNRFDSCWRWLAGRSDSPWYPTLRIYRQPAAGDWGAVVEAVAADLARLAAVSR